MRTLATLLVLAMLLAASAATAAPATSNKGLRTACERSGNDNPCAYSGLLAGGTVGAGQTQTYEDGNYTVTGTIVVDTGGTLVIDNATFLFESTSGGIFVQPGGTLIIVASILREGDTGSSFVLDLAPTSFFTLNLTRVIGGEGVKLATSNANFSGNVLEDIPLALHILDANATIHHNEFRNNSVAVNQTGGFPTLSHNRFDGGDVCVRDWLSHPTTVHNVFRGCHIGIWHERSESELSFNDMEDREDPLGSGIVVKDTNSPTIQGNRIARYGTGILIVDARAYIRGNEILDNVADGVRVVRNSGPMDITGNNITVNGGNGITLVDTADIEVAGNLIANNAAEGAFASGATRLRLTGNDVLGNGANGTVLVDAPGAVVEDNDAARNAGRGFRVAGASEGAVLRRNTATGNAWHGFSLESRDLTLALNHGNANGGAGFWVGYSQRVTLSGDIAKSNAISGFYVVESHHVNATDVTANENAAWGYAIAGAGTHVLLRANASGNGQHGFVVNDLDGAVPANVTLAFARALHNVEDGLHAVIASQHTRVEARDGWWQGNGGFGVHNFGAAPPAVIDARDGYWGSATGPTHSGNPNGTGDRVSDHVLYKPYRCAPPGTTDGCGGTLA